MLSNRGDLKGQLRHTLGKGANVQDHRDRVCNMNVEGLLNYYTLLKYSERAHKITKNAFHLKARLTQLLTSCPVLKLDVKVHLLYKRRNEQEFKLPCMPQF